MERRPQIIAVVGPNGSGKSSTISEILISENIDVPFINPDIVESEKFSHIKDRFLRSKHAQIQCDKMRDYFIAQKTSFGFETVGSHPSKYEFLHKARNLGYEVIVMFTSTECPKINIRRVKKRVSEGGHNISPDPKEEEDKITKRWHRTMYYLKEYIDVAHRVYVFDNSVDGRNSNLVLKVNNGKETVYPETAETNWIYKYYLNRCDSLKAPHFG